MIHEACDNTSKIPSTIWRTTDIITILVSLITTFGILLKFDWRILIILISLIIPNLFLSIRTSNLRWILFEWSTPTGREASYYKYSLLGGGRQIQEIKVSNFVTYIVNKFEQLSNKIIRMQEKIAVKEAINRILLSLIENLLIIIVIIMLVKPLSLGIITVGSFTFLFTISMRFSGSTLNLSENLNNFYETALFLSPLYKLLNFKPKIKEDKQPLEFPSKIKRGIVFKNVSFKYPGSKRYILKNFNLEIKPKESIAIVGENGSGKTTLIKLLTRLYDPTSGEILIDGINLKRFSLKSLYENIGVIFQDFFRFEGLIHENIALSQVSNIKNISRVHKSAQIAEAWKFIKNLKMKYKTHLGRSFKKTGEILSVGQWQKIALARAFFKDAQILCLDEPTASIDAKAEYEIFKKFKKFTTGKITILISHRFSTVTMANKIIVIENGKIIEEGSHSELMRKKENMLKCICSKLKGIYLELKPPKSKLS